MHFRHEHGITDSCGGTHQPGKTGSDEPGVVADGKIATVHLVDRSAGNCDGATLQVYAVIHQKIPLDNLHGAGQIVEIQRLDIGGAATASLTEQPVVIQAAEIAGVMVNSGSGSQFEDSSRPIVDDSPVTQVKIALQVI